MLLGWTKQSSARTDWITRKDGDSSSSSLDIFYPWAVKRRNINQDLMLVGTSCTLPPPCDFKRLSSSSSSCEETPTKFDFWREKTVCRKIYWRFLKQQHSIDSLPWYPIMQVTWNGVPQHLLFLFLENWSVTLEDHSSLRKSLVSGLKPTCRFAGLTLYFIFQSCNFLQCYWSIIKNQLLIYFFSLL